MNAAVSRRQPLTGTAISALCGILLAEFFELPTALLWPTIALAAVVGLARATAGLIHLLVATAFFALHLCNYTMPPARN